MVCGGAARMGRRRTRAPPSSDPITVDDVLNSRMIAYPFRHADVLPGHRRRRRADPDRGRARQGLPDQSRSTSSAPAKASRRRWSARWRTSPARAPSASPARRPSSEAGINHNDVDHLMIYDAFAHLPLYGLEDLGFVPRGEAAAFIAERNTAPGRQAAAEHQWRRPELHALRHVRHVRAAGERAPDARHRAGAGPGRQDLGLPRRRRHVRRLRHDHLHQRSPLTSAAPPLRSPRPPPSATPRPSPSWPDLTRPSIPKRSRNGRPERPRP